MHITPVFRLRRRGRRAVPDAIAETMNSDASLNEEYGPMEFDQMI